MRFRRDPAVQWYATVAGQQRITELLRAGAPMLGPPLDGLVT
jgi:hypothetical protein